MKRDKLHNRAMMPMMGKWRLWYPGGHEGHEGHTNQRERWEGRDIMKRIKGLKKEGTVVARQAEKWLHKAQGNLT